MGNDKTAAPTIELGEARDYVLIIEGEGEQVGSDRRPIKVILAALKEARQKAYEKESLITWHDPILEGDEDGNGVVHYFEPLKIKGIKTPAASDLDDDEDDDLEDEVQAIGEAVEGALDSPEEAAEVGSLFNLTPPAAPGHASAP